MKMPLNFPLVSLWHSVSCAFHLEIIEFRRGARLRVYQRHGGTIGFCWHFFSHLSAAGASLRGRRRSSQRGVRNTEPLIISGLSDFYGPDANSGSYPFLQIRFFIFEIPGGSTRNFIKS